MNRLSELAIGKRSVTLLLAAVPLLLAGLAVVQVDKKNARRAWRATTSILHSISAVSPFANATANS